MKKTDFLLKIITTSDGSHTIYVPELNESYHSTYGAIQESEHIYINEGYRSTKNNPVRIFEFGFGTGLNTILTYIESQKDNRRVEYLSLDKYPLEEDFYKKLNYVQLIPVSERLFYEIHECEWNKEHIINDTFTLLKLKSDIRDINQDIQFDLVYFDAFGPDKQPELWTFDILKIIGSLTKPGGLFITYSAKGQLKRDLIKLGYEVSHPPGPRGKKQITKAVKKA